MEGLVATLALIWTNTNMGEYVMLEITCNENIVIQLLEYQMFLLSKVSNQAVFCFTIYVYLLSTINKNSGQNLHFSLDCGSKETHQSYSGRLNKIFKPTRTLVDRL
jgi:hypothetical protein